MSEEFRIAIAGLGTVGTGLVQLIEEQSNLLAGRTNRRFRIVAVSARDRGRSRPVDIGAYEWFDDAVAMARETAADVVVELIGGSDGPAKAVCEAAMAAGRHVITANKALLAVHGTDLARAAEEAGVSLCYEAAVAGGVPIVKALREGLAANTVLRVYGILNGTSNFILSNMRETGRDFDDVLQEAQALGYAESDPSFDVDGVDAAHKLAILTSLAFGCEVRFDGVYTEGIRHISPMDIRFADELGYRVKLLAVTRRNGTTIEQRVHPCMVSLRSPIAYVEGVLNAVVAEADYCPTTVYEGPGAGARATASAVAADLVDIAEGRRAPTFGVPASALRSMTPMPMERHRGAYYVRLMVLDRPGVIADVTAALRDEAVSMESMLQRGRAPDETVPVVLTTHETEEAAMNRALARIDTLDAVREPPCLIRIEDL